MGKHNKAPASFPFSPVRFFFDQEQHKARTWKSQSTNYFFHGFPSSAEFCNLVTNEILAKGTEMSSDIHKRGESVGKRLFLSSAGGRSMVRWFNPT
jgi:hypothetical protein